jgi:hypothetical protein
MKKKTETPICNKKLFKEYGKILIIKDINVLSVLFMWMLFYAFHVLKMEVMKAIVLRNFRRTGIAIVDVHWL